MRNNWFHLTCQVKAFTASPHLTQCVLSCQREVEDDMDSYQVPFESPAAAAHPLVHTAA